MKLKKMIYLLILMSMIFSFFAFTPDVALAAEDAPPVDPYTTPWCTQHAGCGRYGVRNRTDGWLQLYMTSMLTGEKHFFTVRSGDNVYIHVRPGQYMVTYVWWCSGKMGSWTKTWSLNQYWTDVFRCPGGFSTGLYRGSG